jgi:hypothetical protein
VQGYQGGCCECGGLNSPGSSFAALSTVATFACVVVLLVLACGWHVQPHIPSNQDAVNGSTNLLA